MHGAARQIEEMFAGLLAGKGLELRGWFALEAGDIPAGAQGVAPGMTAVLIGNHGPAMWDAFAGSPELGDGEPHPMDRWTRRTVHEAVGRVEIPAVALFPFGAELWPFQRFAKRAMGLSPSPLGLLIHPRYGLWHALRAAIVFPQMQPFPAQVHKVIHPCDTCIEKPCLNACPVGAFSSFGFDVAACRGWLEGGRSSHIDSSGPDCMGKGCAARNACPVAQQWRYSEAQLRFHMAAFRS
jgi:hypothetical protein